MIEHGPIKLTHFCNSAQKEREPAGNAKDCMSLTVFRKALFLKGITELDNTNTIQIKILYFTFPNT